MSTSSASSARVRAMPTHDQGGAHAQAGPRTYLVIAGFLLVLTIMEVAAFYIPAVRPILVPLLIALATAKFALVALFYMHLRFDSGWFSTLFVFPLVIAIGLATALLWLFGIIGTTGRLPGGG